MLLPTLSAAASTLPETRAGRKLKAKAEDFNADDFNADDETEEMWYTRYDFLESTCID
jgi:hypothetical protein